MYAAVRFSVFAAAICFITCEDKCGSPHEIDRATVSAPPDSGYVFGSTVAYKCDYGFITGGIVKTSRCVRDSTTDELVWTKPEITCNPRSCGDPGIVENARRNGSRFTFPNSVEFICNEGYRLSGPSRRYCEASGTWSGRLPSCRIISCSRPEDPENGKAVYASLEYGSELTYECNRDLQLSTNKPRICGSDGTWTGVKPLCRETECEMPDKPEFGSMELVGNKPKVGSIVIYKCDPGRRLVGSSNSKCLKSSEWTFPTPLCVVPCTVPLVTNGQLGKYEEEYKRYRWRTVFKEVFVGTTLDENEHMILKCNDDYVPRAQASREITITCLQGKLSPEPECVTTSCLDDPPPILNGRAVVRRRNHGHTIWYTCEHGFEKVSSGKVECVYGVWTGNTPVCGDTRCNRELLNYPGLVRGEGFLFSKQSFEPTCLPGYEVTEKSDTKIYCDNGNWIGNLPPCTLARCKTEDLLGFSGLVIRGHGILDEGDFLQPICAEGFEFSDKNDSKLYCREGTWKGNIPPCTPAHCLNDPPVPENGRIKLIRAIGHGSAVEYECLPLYEIDGESNVVCGFGKWTGSPPACKDTRCYIRNLPRKKGVDLTNSGPVYSNKRANIVCKSGYSLRFPEVYCEHGEWKTENLQSPCQESACQVNHIPNGEMLEERETTVGGFMGIGTKKKTVYDPVNIGTYEIAGTSLYVKCSGQYRFQGEEGEDQVEVTCSKGEWTPLPVCMLPGERLDTDLPEAEGTVNVDAPLNGVSTSEISQLNNSIIKTSDSARGTAVVGGNPLSVNSSLEEVSGEGLVNLGNSTESEIIESVFTEATVIPSCTCSYVVEDRILIAYDGKKIMKYGDEISSGSILAFYCNTTGFFRLRGSPSLMCPSDCAWHSSMFPSCISPADDDVIIRVSALPSENMNVGPGGVLTVIPGTRLEFTCRGFEQSSFVDWIVPPSSSGFKQSDITTNGMYRMHYSIQQATQRHSGKYTCFKNYGQQSQSHSVDIEVKDVQCPEIQQTAELWISYAPNTRTFGSIATFHCFTPHKRDGPSSVTCEASGFWSGPPASCYLPPCTMESINDIIPQGVVPLIEGEISEKVPFGYVLELGCEEHGYILQGSRSARCDAEGVWKVGPGIQCIQGCARVQKKTGSQLLVSPKKEFYDMGEFITFSCPQGKRLIGDVERILCSTRGWIPDNIPDCQ